MNAAIDELCRAARAELATMGELGRPLLVVLDTVVGVAGERGPGVLADPLFALDVLDTTRRVQPACSAAMVGRVLDHLRARSGITTVAVRQITVAEAARRWEQEGFALNAERTRDLYRTWVRRLVLAHGEAEAATLTAVDLSHLIAGHTRGPAPRPNRRHGRAAEEAAVSAFRHFWAFLVQTGAAPRNVALSLRKPLRPPPLRRPIKPDEATLLRQLARMGTDPLLDETALCLVERLGLRPLELRRLRLCDVDLAHHEVQVVGKGHRPRRLPLPPHLATLVDRYVEDRRPEKVPPAAWAVSAEPLLRRRPRGSPHLGGQPVPARWVERLFDRIAAGAPQLPHRDSLSLYSYRHALATWVDARYGRATTRRILGHVHHATATDDYVHSDDATVWEALVAYEAYLLDMLRLTPQTF